MPNSRIQIKLKALLSEELENKKVFDALPGTDCNVCGNEVEEGDPIRFMGNKEKVCPDCWDELEEMVESA